MIRLIGSSFWGRKASHSKVEPGQWNTFPLKVDLWGTSKSCHAWVGWDWLGIFSIKRHLRGLAAGDQVIAVGLGQERRLRTAQLSGSRGLWVSLDPVSCQDRVQERLHHCCGRLGETRRLPVSKAARRLLVTLKPDITETLKPCLVGLGCSGMRDIWEPRFL